LVQRNRGDLLAKNGGLGMFIRIHSPVNLGNYELQKTDAVPE
jgi:hypothetical protein